MSPPSEPFGTTPIPTSVSGSPVKVWFDADSALSIAQQPQSQQIAVFEATPSEVLNGSILDVNQHFVVYGVKNGLIRILHRHSTLRSLLRAHKGQTLTDVRFFQDGDVLATVAHSPERSSVIIWRVFQRSPEILSEILLEVTTTKFTTWRVVWHPFNPNQFWMIHNDARGKTVATLVESTRITTTLHPQHGHAVCVFHQDFVIMQGAVQLTTASVEDGTGCAADSSAMDANLTDLCWSDRETRHVITSHDNGEIRLWDLKKLHANPNGTVSPVCMTCIKEESPISRCLLLPLEDQGENNWTPCFLTASAQNSEITLWSSFSERGKPTKMQILALEQPASSYLVEVCSGPAPADASPPSCFLVMADRTAGKILAFHLRSVWSEDGKAKKAMLVGCDYVVPFEARNPTFSWSVASVPTTDISEEDLNEQGGIIFDMKLFVYQSSVVQSLTLTSYMCLPPENSWTDPTSGVRVERLREVHSAHVSDIGSDTGTDDPMVYDEDYDVGDEDEDDVGEYNSAPEASALPLPDGLSSPNSGPVFPVPSLSNNPFANWLGAIASKTTADPLPPPPPQPSAPPASDLPPPQPSAPPVPTPPPPPAPHAFLSPMDILAGASKKSPADGSEGRITPSRSNKSTPAAAPAPAQAHAGRGPIGKQRKKSPKRQHSGAGAPSPDRVVPGGGGKIQILKRDAPPVVESQKQQYHTPVPVPAPASSSDSATPVAADNAGLVQVTPEMVRQAVSLELRNSVIPHLEKTIQASINVSVTQPILAAIHQLSVSTTSGTGIKVDTDHIARQVCKSVDQPLRAAFADSMKSVVIPTLESITSQVFSQVATHLDKHQEETSKAAAVAAAAAAAAAANKEPGPNKDLEAISKQLTTMTTLVAKLTDEVQSLRSIVIDQQRGATSSDAGGAGAVGGAQGAPPGLPKKNSIETLQKEILEELEEGQFESAFTKAVAASNMELIFFCCTKADLNAVLGGSAPTLSQPILLCLMQQLGTILMSGKQDRPALQLVLDWLQEVALSLHPTDPQIQAHAPAVLQQLVAAINARMAQGDPSLRRPLQRLLQIVRGMTVGL